MVLEDELLISMDIELALVDAGFQVVMARSCAEADAFPADHRSDAAVLDVRLEDGDCIEAAKTLVLQGVPFVVHSGMFDDMSDPVFRLAK